MIRPRFKRRVFFRRAVSRFHRLHPGVPPLVFMDRAIVRECLRWAYEREQEVLYGTRSGKGPRGVIHAKERSCTFTGRT